MDFNGFKSDYDRNGFVVVRQFLSATELEELRGELDRYIRDVVPNLPDSHAFYHDVARPETLKQLQHMAGDEFFQNYRSHPRWSSLATTLVGEPTTAKEPEWFNKPPQTIHPTPPHQDNFYFCLRPSNVVTLWLALDSVDEDNGCLRYVATSHLGGIRDHQPSKVLGFSQTVSDYNEEDAKREQQIVLEPGDVVAHHGETIHRADPNQTDRHRRAFAMVFFGTSCKHDEIAHARYQASLKQQHRAMGLNVD